ncbi:hypothetical protein [Prochlorothrix hollandica]|uniref:hypothetical protein n=1 Tax=Prochlorothrix hollandica TaxID=1223 RepID=UPI00034D6F2F|nr:hypothetical protein [Prochlorothrix hollandica]
MTNSPTPTTVEEGADYIMANLDSSRSPPRSNGSPGFTVIRLGLLLLGSHHN